MAEILGCGRCVEVEQGTKSVLGINEDSDVSSSAIRNWRVPNRW